MFPLVKQAESVLARLPLAYPASGSVYAIPRSEEPHRFYDVSKRALDLIVTTPLLLLTSPLVLAASLLITLGSGRPPFLAQRRVGYRGETFLMLKLRTMRNGSGDDAEFANPHDAFVRKEPSDPRVTAVGRLLRRTSVDELPQLLNVLRGDMSLVGPRPCLPSEEARYPAGWLRRLEVKPGISGLWQVSGRSNVPPRRRVALDRYYLRRRSLTFDALILLRTLPAVLSRRGAW